MGSEAAEVRSLFLTQYLSVKALATYIGPDLSLMCFTSNPALYSYKAVKDAPRPCPLYQHVRHKRSSWLSASYKPSSSCCSNSGSEQAGAKFLSHCASLPSSKNQESLKNENKQW